MAMTDGHRLFLQAMISERICSEERATNLYKVSAQANRASFRDLENFVDVINVHLQTVDLRLQFGLTDIKGERFLALVNQEGDELAQMSTEYNATEIAFFKKVIDLIVTSDDSPFVRDSITLIKDSIKDVNSGAQRLTNSEGEKLLGHFLQDMWLEIVSDGEYSLGLRSLLELKVYLKEGYPDHIFNCHLCRDVVALGESCQNHECDVRMHIRCTRSYFQNPDTAACPSCKTSWIFSKFSDGVADTGDSGRGSSSKSVNSRSRGTSKRQRQNDLIDDEEDGEPDEPLVRSTRSSRS